MPLLIVVFGVALLLVLMIAFKLNGFLSLIIVALSVGIMEGMPLPSVVLSITKGVGGTLGSLALVLGFGAMLGKLMADSGGAQRIALTLIDKFGKKHIQLAVILTGFIVGIALFYEIGFVLLLPLVFSIAAAADIPLLYIGVPMAAALSATHGFLPPHPGPTAIAAIYKADLGKTLIYGIVCAVPAVIFAGPVLTKFLRHMEHDIPKGLYNPKTFTDKEMPSFGISVFTALVPVILMAARAIATINLPKTSPILNYTNFLGDPVIALLIAVLLAIFTFGLNNGKRMPEVMKTVTESIAAISMILLIIGGGGAFKQVLVDSGVADYVAQIMKGSTVSPLVLAWSIAAILRIALGSATVAGLTAAGIVGPLVVATGASPELMVLATGAGSLIFSHVNDPGFWMFKEYFNLSIPETLKSWSVLETIISVVGLVMVLLLSMVVH
ncbi:gluconate:H+ symporter [Clostridium estertheticum]|uniref:gluconate:H+ symporter n=1 Tax=Clostridium estertheticum TaxID=238834 RepID=UPI001CF16E5E|nr:gluconate:H+ symporter [Clostridium estertheticum]MCB2356711.1 gluconate:H+ symporter [Clostridium estertheticum]WAG39741.1 gluconate:H+ symporter [Clostridium estertheticum]